MERGIVRVRGNHEGGSMMIEAMILVVFIALWVGFSVIEFTDKSRKELKQHQFERSLK